MEITTPSEPLASTLTSEPLKLRFLALPLTNEPVSKTLVDPPEPESNVPIETLSKNLIFDILYT